MSICTRVEVLGIIRKCQLIYVNMVGSSLWQVSGSPEMALKEQPGLPGEKGLD